MVAILSRLCRRPVWWIAGLAVPVVLVLAAGSTWFVMTNRVADDVVVGWDLDCGEGGTAAYQGKAAIKSRVGWRCAIRLTITNRSGRDVRVRRVDGPLLGSAGGAEIRGISTEHAELRDTGSDGIDGEWEVDLVVPSDASRALTVAVGWRGEGCNSGGYLTLENWPTIQFETFYRTFDVAAEQNLILRTFDDPHDEGTCK